MLSTFINYLKKSDYRLAQTAGNVSYLKYLSRFLKSALVLTLLAYFFIVLQMTAPVFFTQYIGSFNTRQTGTQLYLVIYALLFYLAVPLAISQFIYGENPSDVGLRPPQNRSVTLFLITGSLLLLGPNIFYFAKLKAFQIDYSLGNPSLMKFAFMQIILLPLYYFAEEFFFRGFLFFGLWRKVGWHSFWITDILFTYAHLGKPGLEIALAIPASVVLNYLTLKTRSIYPAVFVHASLGALLNILLYLNAPSF